MKKNKIILLVLSVIVLALLGISVYVNFIAKNSSGFSYIILAGLLIGILGSMCMIIFGNKHLDNKKDYHVLTIGFLVLVFTLGISILNIVYGYNNLLDFNNYKEYMVYVSTITNTYIYALFTFVVGFIDLNLYIKHVVGEKK